MAKKKKHEEHENLERWLVSYADFMTLLFATFVVLYALSQIDISGYEELEESINRSFKTMTLMEGGGNIMTSDGDSLMNQNTGDSILPPLIMEYLSQKYEQDSYENIQKEIEILKKTDPDFKNITVTIEDRGLVIKINDKNILFSSGSANLTESSKKYIKTIGDLINKRFKVHLIRIEGHTDNLPIQGSIYPTNWELSSARASSIVRFLINNSKINPKLFSAVGFAETRPVVDNKNATNRSINRRVEIIVLRNKHKNLEHGNPNILDKDIVEQEKQKYEESLKLQKIEQEELKKKREKNNKLKNKEDNLSPFSSAAQILIDDTNTTPVNVILLKDVYEDERKRIEIIETTPKKMFE